MPKFGNVFSNEGKGASNDGGERRNALTAEEVASRLYPKPTDTWRREYPSAVVVAEPAPPVPAEPEVRAVKEEDAPMAAVEPGEDSASSATREPAPTASYSAPKASETPQDEPVAAAVPVERLVSVISRNSVFDGNYATDGDVRVEGEVRGDITCKGHVLICNGATVNAKISATSVAVAGRLSGEVTCTERFEAQPTARITSQISTPRLVIQEGAVVDGQIRMGVQE
ncbi:MAG: bactofilin family protein [Chloroflexota bacterium]